MVAAATDVSTEMFIDGMLCSHWNDIFTPLVSDLKHIDEASRRFSVHFHSSSSGQTSMKRRDERLKVSAIVETNESAKRFEETWITLQPIEKIVEDSLAREATKGPQLHKFRQSREQRRDVHDWLASFHKEITATLSEVIALEECEMNSFPSSSSSSSSPSTSSTLHTASCAVLEATRNCISGLTRNQPETTALQQELHSIMLSLSTIDPQLLHATNRRAEVESHIDRLLGKRREAWESCLLYTSRRG